jgi:hypothetical protein
MMRTGSFTWRSNSFQLFTSPNLTQAIMALSMSLRRAASYAARALPLIITSLVLLLSATRGLRATGTVAAASQQANSISDDFNRIDSNGLGTDYESPFYNGGTHFDVNSNTAVRSSTAGNASTLWATPFGANQRVRIKLISRGSATSYASLFNRASGGGTALQTGYRVRVNFNLIGFDMWTISKVVATVETDLGTGTLNLAAGDEMELVINGSTLAALRIRAGATTQVLQVTNETSISTGGQIGFGVSGSGGYTPAVLDDFSGGTMPGSVATSTATPTPTATPTLVPSPTHVSTRTPTSTPTSTRTSAPTGTASPTATATPTTPPFPTAAATATMTATVTQTPTATALSIVETATQTPTATATQRPSFVFIPFVLRR